MSSQEMILDMPIGTEKGIILVAAAGAAGKLVCGPHLQLSNVATKAHWNLQFDPGRFELDLLH
jgi:hypothetical protein